VQLEDVGCYLCGSKASRLWGEENGYTAVRCVNCGLVYTSPRPPNEEIDEAAQTGLHSTERGQLDVVGRYNRRVERRYHAYLTTLFAGAAPSDQMSWLDIGTGFGEMLIAVTSLLPEGSRVEGIEPCLPKVEEARKRGLNVAPRRMEEIEDTYDVISLMNVYSHLPDPIEFLTRLRRLLRDGGELVLLTGNGGDLERSEYPGPLTLPDHLSFVGHVHLREVLSQAGYDVVRETTAPPDVQWIRTKNLAKRVLGRTPRIVKKDGRFHYILVRARSRTS